MKLAFGPLLREWRKIRRYSQLQLSVEIDVSTRHLSFLETGRAEPSREMILLLGNHLQQTKREINRGLHLAGFAPAFGEFENNPESTKHVIQAIENMLENHMPYPAIVLNQNWDITNSNASADLLLNMLGATKNPNLVEVLVTEQGREMVSNWNDVARELLIRLRYEISFLAQSDRLEELEALLLSFCDDDEKRVEANINDVVVTTNFKFGDQALSFFSIVAQLGTIQDITISEQRIELMFPSDAKTTLFFQNMK